MGLKFFHFEIEKYERDTKDLTMVQDGAYSRLLRAYYSRGGPLPADPEALFRLARAFSVAEQEATLAVVRFFVRDGDMLRHPKCDKVITKVLLSSAAQKKRAHKRWDKDHPGEPPPPSGPPPISTKPIRKPKPLRPLDAPYPDTFERFWGAYPTKAKGSKLKAFETWEKLKLDARLDALITDVTDRGKKDSTWMRGFVPHVVTYLNQRRWEGDIDTSAPRGRLDRQTTEAMNRETAAAWANEDIALEHHRDDVE